MEDMEKLKEIVHSLKFAMSLDEHDDYVPAYNAMMKFASSVGDDETDAAYAEFAEAWNALVRKSRLELMKAKKQGGSISGWICELNLD